MHRGKAQYLGSTFPMWPWMDKCHHRGLRRVWRCSGMRDWVTPPGKPRGVALMVAEDKETRMGWREGRGWRAVVALTPIARAGAVVCPADLHPLWFPAGRKPTRAVPKCVWRCESPQQKEMCSSDPLREATRHPASRSVLADHGQQVLLSHNLVIELRSHDTQGTPGQGQSKAVVQGS